MALATQSANLFELSCDETHVTYSTSGFAGPPLLSYSGPEGDLSFQDDEIEELPGPLGTEVTVTVASVPDLHTITFTLLVPALSLSEGDESPFETLAIKTTNRTSILGWPHGAAQSYEALALRGLARSVLF